VLRRRDKQRASRGHPDYCVEAAAAVRVCLPQSLLLENRAVVSLDGHGEIAVDDLIGSARCRR
jgi:hypothetical protein